MGVCQIFFNFANHIESPEGSGLSLVSCLFSDHWKTYFQF